MVVTMWIQEADAKRLNGLAGTQIAVQDADGRWCVRVCWAKQTAADYDVIGTPLPAGEFPRQTDDGATGAPLPAGEFPRQSPQTKDP